MTVWFTSDTHFDHKNIIKYCNRPFSDVDEMNAEMVRRWNATVAPTDRVFHLGDFAFTARRQRLHEIVSSLNGSITLVQGNHDNMRRNLYLQAFDDVVTSADLFGYELPVYLAHHPAWELPPEDAACYNGLIEYQLCGHVHTLWKMRSNGKGLTMLNVGVDQWDFRPISLEQVREALQI